MNWTILILSAWFLIDIAWLLYKRRTIRPVRFALSVIGSFGILVLLACCYLSALPSHAPLRTVTGLATDRSSGIFNRLHSQFILIEWETGNRFLFSTTIDGPWADQPVLVTYADDDRYLKRVVRIEILS